MGEPLPNPMAKHFGAAYGTDLQHVRIHRDAPADQAAKGLAAAAFTTGSHIYFAEGHYDPGSPAGLHLIGHELAHVVQQDGQPEVQRRAAAATATLDEAHDAAEHEADRAAEVALAGGRLRPVAAPPRLRRFAQGNGSRLRGGHAYMTERALAHMGLDDEQERDEHGTVVRHAETRVARMGNWERDFSQLLTPATREHLGPVLPLINILALKSFGRGIDYASFGSYDPVEHIDNPAGLRGSDVLDQGPQVDGSGNNPYDHVGGPLRDAGPHNEAYAKLDPRYLLSRSSSPMASGLVMNAGDAPAYQVDESGLARYIETSRLWCTRTLRQAAALGRGKEATGKEYLRGPQLFASGVHTLQDFYAHSNFCEIALNLLIRSGTLVVRDAHGQLASVAPTRVLDTGAHPNDARAQPLLPNLAHAGREALVTGSFNLTDTLVSLLGELTDGLESWRPFGAEGPSPLVMACLDYLDLDPENPTEFGRVARKMAGRLRQAEEELRPLAPGMARKLERLGMALEGRQHTARELYLWLREHGPLDLLVAGARELPVIGEQVAQALVALQRTLHELVAELMNALWERSVQRVLPKLHERIPGLRRDTNLREKRRAPTGGPLDRWTARQLGNIADFYDPSTGRPQNGIAPSSYTPPSHSEVAKDHGPLAAPAGQRLGPEGEHDHVAHWLNPLAERLAERATMEVGQVVSRLWNEVETLREMSTLVEPAPEGPMFDAIDEVVNRFFRHPADCPETWRDIALAMLTADRRSLGPELFAHLASPQTSRRVEEAGIVPMPTSKVERGQR